MHSTLHIGIDENGLGPRLGPLVVTAAAAHLAPGADKLLHSRLDLSLRSVL